MTATPITGEITIALPTIWTQGAVSFDDQRNPIAIPHTGTVFEPDDVRIWVDGSIETATNLPHLVDGRWMLTLTDAENVEGAIVLLIDQDDQWVVSLPCCFPFLMAEDDTQSSIGDSTQEVLAAIHQILGVVKNKPLRAECDSNDRLQMMRGDDFTEGRAKMLPVNVMEVPAEGSKAIFTVRGQYCDSLLVEQETTDFVLINDVYSALFELPKFMESEKAGIYKFDVEFRPHEGRVETVSWGELNLIEDQTRPAL